MQSGAGTFVTSNRPNRPETFSGHDRCTPPHRQACPDALHCCELA